MIIELGTLGYSTGYYYVRITERVEEIDKLHHTDKTTTSPKLETEEMAKDWLIRWLDRHVG